MKPHVLHLGCLLSTLAFAAPDPTLRRIAVLMVPMDQGAEAWAPRIESFMNEALKEYRGLNVRSSEDLFNIQNDPDADQALKRAETGYNEGKVAFDKRDYAVAERKLKVALKEFAKAAAALKECGHLCDAQAMYAASLQARGDIEEAKLATLDLIALNPTFELDRKRYPATFLTLRTQVATSPQAQKRGNIQVTTDPSGAAIYLDGQLQTVHTPTTLNTLSLGKHLLRVERPGHRRYGVMVEVTPEDTHIKTELKASSAYRSYDNLLDKLADEATAGKGGATMSSIAKTLELDRGVVVVLKEINDNGGLEMTASLFDLRNGKREAAKRTHFQGDEFGQLRGEIGRAVNLLMNEALSKPDPKARSSDPLENRTGMDDWGDSDRGGAREAKQKKAGDPLKGKTGTEDW